MKLHSLFSLLDVSSHGTLVNGTDSKARMFRNPSSSTAGSVTLSKLLNHSAFQLPHLYNRKK